MNTTIVDVAVRRRASNDEMAAGVLATVRQPIATHSTGRAPAEKPPRAR